MTPRNELRKLAKAVLMQGCFADRAKMEEKFEIAANPATVLSLLDALDAAEARIAELEFVTEKCRAGIDFQLAMAQMRAALTGRGKTG